MGTEYNEKHAGLVRVLSDLERLKHGLKLQQHWVGGENRIMRKPGGPYIVVTLMWDMITITVGDTIYTLQPGAKIFLRPNGKKIFWMDVIGDIRVHLV